ncbi:hypothetical protein D3C87_1762560 [compost metagenome]
MEVVVVIVAHYFETLHNAFNTCIIGYQIDGQISGGQTADHKEKHLNYVCKTDYLHPADRNDNGKCRQRDHTELEIKP